MQGDNISSSVLSFALANTTLLCPAGFGGSSNRFGRMFVSVLLFILFFVPISALPFSLSSQSSDSAQVPQNLAPFSPNPPQVLQNLASSSSNPAQTSPTFPTWLAVERVPFSTDNVGGDAVLVRAEHCLRPCAEVLGSAGAVSIPRARCVCRCPSGEQLFVQTAEGTGKCAAKAPDCPGRTFRFDRSSENADPQMFAPVLSLPRQGEALSTELRIAWKESGVKVRPGHGPRCSIQSAFLLASQAIWRPLDGDLFRLGWMDGEGRVIWTGIEKDAEELAGGIVQLVLECAAGKSGNGSFCVAFRVEGQIESQFALRGEDSTAAGDVGVELDSGRRAEVVAIILLAILLFLSVCSSIFLWNVCWRMEKRKLIQSLQLQFLHYAKQEKDKTIAECQLRYQALVKAAAGVQHQQQQQHGSASPHIGIANGGFLNANGGGSTTDGEEYGLTSMDTPQQQRRKLYFSAGEKALEAKALV
uniref:Transmembrane protein n=1 Tax=Globodera rostochiensis TaxID=31243 RepID=A0A914IAF8_GLORO